MLEYKIAYVDVLVNSFVDSMALGVVVFVYLKFVAR